MQLLFLLQTNSNGSDGGMEKHCSLHHAIFDTHIILVLHKTSLNKFKMIEVISNIISDHTSMKLEINNRRKTGKFMDTWKLNTILNNHWVEEEIKGKSKNILKQMKMETQHKKIWSQ